MAENGHKVNLWYPTRKKAREIEKSRQLEIKGSNYILHQNISVSSGHEIFTLNNQILYCVLPSREFEDTMESIFNKLNHNHHTILAILTKGFVSRPTRRKHNIFTFSQYCNLIVKEKNLNAQVAVLNGPSLLGEILEGKYTFFNIGCPEPKIARQIGRFLQNDYVHTSTDENMFGVELGGILKNPIAIASGISQKLPRAGSNFHGVLLCRGISEIQKIYETLDAGKSAIFSISTIGDLVTSSISPLSRNKQFGNHLIHDELNPKNQLSIRDKLELLFWPSHFIENQAMASENTVEGGLALRPIMEIAKEKKIELPLFGTIHDILIHSKEPEALINLFSDSLSAKPATGIHHNRHIRGAPFTAGHHFNKLINQRVNKQITGTRGLQVRIQKQSASIVRKLKNRLSQAITEKNEREIEEFPREIQMWESLMKATPDELKSTIEDLIAYYIQEISDNFKPLMRGTLIRTMAPARFLLSGFRKGSGLPYMGGQIKELKKLSLNYNIMYAPMHRSHLDSVELAFGLLASGLPIPRYAAGINLMANPIWGWLLKSLGAYTVDRQRIRNIIYLECLSGYSSMTLEAGVPSLVFCEGTRSRTGASYPVKTGLLSTAIKTWRDSGNEILIVPITLSYERVPEDTEFVEKLISTRPIHYLKHRTRVYINICESIPVSKFIHHEEPAVEIAANIEHQWRKYQLLLPNQIIARLLSENDGELEYKNLEYTIKEFITANPGNYLSHNPVKIKKKGLRILKKRKFIEIKDNKILSLLPKYIHYYASMIPDPNSM